MTSRRRWRGTLAASGLLLMAWAFALESAEAKRGTFSLEIAGGFLSIDPADFNRVVETDELVRQLQYDHYFEYLLRQNRIRGWSVAANGGRNPVRVAWMLEPRLRYRLGGSLSLSAGLRFLQGERGREARFEYTRELLYSGRYVESLAFSPYRLRVQGYWPSIGLHLDRAFNRRFSAEVHAVAGPLFARVSYRSAWTYAWDMRGTNYSWPVFRDSGERMEKGLGLGIGLELGGRISLALGPRLSVFLAGGHGWRRVESLSGSGQETRAGRVETWSGEWVTREETLRAPWEELLVRYPTSRPQAGANDSAFRLDLSGWQLQAGLSWRL